VHSATVQYILICDDCIFMIICYPQNPFTIQYLLVIPMVKFNREWCTSKQLDICYLFGCWYLPSQIGLMKDPGLIYLHQNLFTGSIAAEMV
jgi:hypothetical protein